MYKAVGCFNVEALNGSILDFIDSSLPTYHEKISTPHLNMLSIGKVLGMARPHDNVVLDNLGYIWGVVQIHDILAL